MTLSSLGLPPVDAHLESRLRSRLGDVELALEQSVASDIAFLNQAAGHLLHAGGKRFRPLLLVLAAEFGDPMRAGVVPAALVVELTHLATLYHDDVMDEAKMRRGSLSANARWDNSVAILTGDFLFARAAEIVAGLGPEAVLIQAQTFARLVQGQIRETVGPDESEDPLEHYQSVVADKTGALIATSARFGAMMSGAPSGLVETLTEFGEQIGTAFQLSDDIIDVASESTVLGKTPGTDLREGIPTLPTLIARQSSSPTDSRLLELLAGPISNDAMHAEALRLLRTNPAMTEARLEVTRRGEVARKLLDSVPAIPARQALVGLCDLVTTRSS
ncbi:MAG: polyprenyl synthetase family protein [Nocardioidaceae bacterium]